MTTFREPAKKRVRWQRATRLIPSHYPPIDLFEDLADPADWDALIALEMQTNPRVRDAFGEIRLVPAERRVAGPGASWLMAPFVHCSATRPSRFSDGSYGVYYAGNRFEVALAETVYHFERRMRTTAEPPLDADYRELVGPIDHVLHDIRTVAPSSELYDPDPTRYAPAQQFGRELRARGSDGLVYRSVRWPAGDAVALFWPDVPAVPAQGRHLLYHWDGAAVTKYLVYGESDWRRFPP